MRYEIEVVAEGSKEATQTRPCQQGIDSYYAYM